MHVYSSDYRAILLDKAYKKAAEDLRALHRTRTFAHGVLTTTEIHKNREVSFDRIIKEDYFGHITSFFTLLRHKYRLDKFLYDHILRIFFL